MDDVGGGGGSGNSVIDDPGEFIRLTTTTARIGIGTSSPYAKLSIQGDSNDTPSTTVAIRAASGQSANILDIFDSSGVLTSVLTAGHDLGIGTSSPTEQLSIANRIYVGGTGTSTFENNLIVRGTLQTGSSSLFFTDGGISGSGVITISPAIDSNLNISLSGAGDLIVSTDDLVVDTSTNNVGIGTTSPYEKLSVAGNVVASSFISTSSATSIFNGEVQASFLTITSTGATSTFSNGISLSGGCFELPSGTCLTGTVNQGTVNRLAHYTGTEIVSSANYLVTDVANSRLGIGTSTPGTPLSVTGAGVFTGIVTLPQFAATSTSATSTIAGNLDTAGDIEADQFFALSTSTLTGISNAGFITTTGNLNVANSITVGASSTFAGVQATYLDSTGNLSIAGTAVIQGQTDLQGNVFDSTGLLTLADDIEITGTGTSTAAGNLDVAGDIEADQFFASGSGTSTFAGVEATFLNVTSAGTSTIITGGLDAGVLNITSSAATSTFANDEEAAADVIFKRLASIPPV